MLGGAVGRLGLSALIGFLMLAGAGAAQEGSFGFEAQQVDSEIQGRIEAALHAKYPSWGIESGGSSSRSSVRLVGDRKGESLTIWTQYMVTTDEAKRRLRSYQYRLSIGAGEPIHGIGDEAFLLVYGSQAVLRFRQHEVVVEVRACPEKRKRPWDDGLSPQRQKLVIANADVVAEQIRGF
jgi:hypothetical protein